MRLNHKFGSYDLEREIKKRFADFGRINPPSKTRRFPSDLVEIVCRATIQGIDTPTLCQWTGASAATINRWLKKTEAKVKQPRRLEVIHDRPAELQLAPPGPSASCLHSAVIVRLPSGVTIELRDSRALHGDFLKALSTLEVNHATSR